MCTEGAPVTNIVFGTMTLGYRGYGSRVHDTATAAAMLTMYSDAGYRALDTAHDYGDGSGEQMLGDLGAAQRFTIATRYAPQGANHAQERDKLKAAFRLSLTRLRTDRVSILYLTTRDHGVPLESTLRGIQDLHDEGLFDEFGLSNFSVADIEDVLAITTREGWIRPTVYQGLSTLSPGSWKQSSFQPLPRTGCDSRPTTRSLVGRSLPTSARRTPSPAAHVST